MRDILVGHAHNEQTGVTVVIAPKGAVVGVDVRGSAPGTRETDLCRPCNMVDKAHAVCLCGGSAYGLESTSGVMQYLSENGIGHAASHIVPIVPAAVIYDLNGDEIVFPDKAMGYEACQNAKPNNFESGRVGAGRGATVGKVRGMKAASRGGLGSFAIKCGKIKVEAYFAVNALGDVTDPETGKIVAGTRAGDGSFVNVAQCILDNKLLKLFPALRPVDELPANTTIGAVVTNAKLTKEEANKLAQICHNALARVINPVHTMYDGDTVFVMATGARAVNFTMLGVCAVKCVEKALVSAVVGQADEFTPYLEDELDED